MTTFIFICNVYCSFYFSLSFVFSFTYTIPYIYDYIVFFSNRFTNKQIFITTPIVSQSSSCLFECVCVNHCPFFISFIFSQCFFFLFFLSILRMLFALLFHESKVSSVRCRRQVSYQHSPFSINCLSLCFFIFLLRCCLSLPSHSSRTILLATILVTPTHTQH